MFNDENAPPEREFLAGAFVCIQREIFVDLCHNFFQNVSEKNKSVYSRAESFSKDFNKEVDLDLRKEDFYKTLTPDNFSDFCNYVFDFMNYVKKIDIDLFDQTISAVKEKMSFPRIPTLNATIQGCGDSLKFFLDARENNFKDFMKPPDLQTE